MAHDARAASAPGKVSKAGIASTDYIWSAPSKLSSIGATWVYNWSTHPPPAATSLQWVPMVPNAASLTQKALSSLRLSAERGHLRYLLGFNEPDNAHQADLSPERAAALWPRLEQTGLQLGSPVTDWVGDGWLARFMAIAHKRKLRVNFIALHYYQDFTNPNAVAELRQSLILIHNRYHLPIWVTELGTMDIRAWGYRMSQAPTEALAVTYMRKALGLLNSLSFVKRYAWYTDICVTYQGCGFDGLFYGSGKPTPLASTFAQAAGGASR